MLLLCALIVGGVNSVWATNVTFTFNTDAGIAELGIEKPEAGNGTDLTANYSYTISGVNLTATHGGTNTRVWNSSGTLDLRIYKNGGKLTFTAPGNITQIVLAGTAIGNFTANVGTFTTGTGTWTGDAASVTLTATNTGKISTITVTYTAPAPSISASNVNIAADVLGGNISYSITNPNGSTLTAAKKSGDWLTVGEVDGENNKVPFTATENTGAEREAVVTLTYGEVKKDVTITQAAAVTKYEITYSSSPDNGTLTIKRDDETISTGTEVSNGTILTIIATPNDGYNLVKWEYSTDGGSSWTDGVGTSYEVTSNVQFRASFVAKVYHTITYNVNGVTTPVSVEEGEEVSFAAPASGIPSGYTFKGWRTSTLALTDTDPNDYVTSATSTADITYYAVMAVSTMSEPTLTKLGSSATFSTNDNIVIVAKGTTYALYQETINSSYVNNYTFVDNAATIGADAKKYFKMTANETNWDLGDKTNGYLYTSGSNNLAVSASKTAWTISGNDTEEAFTRTGNSRWLSCRTDLNGDNQNKYRLGGATSGSPSGIAYFDIYKFVPSTEVYKNFCTTFATVTISSLGWSTFSSTDALDFANATPSGLTAYMVTGTSGSNITTAAVNNVPGNTGLLLNGAESTTYTIPVLASSSTITTSNLMKPVVTATTVNYNDNSGYNYVLADNEGTPEFQQIVSGTYGSVNIAAGKAYLSLTTSPAPTLFFNFNDMTGIDEVRSQKEEVKGAYYNLAGQRVAQPTKGLYIVNGRKVVIK